MWRMIGNVITGVIMILGISFLFFGASVEGFNTFSYVWLGIMSIGTLSCFSDFIYFAKKERDKL